MGVSACHACGEEEVDADEQEGTIGGQGGLAVEEEGPYVERMGAQCQYLAVGGP